MSTSRTTGSDAPALARRILRSLHACDPSTRQPCAAHVTGRGLRIGWGADAVLQPGPGEDWRAALARFADEAAAAGRAVAGYVGFDAGRRHASAAPDGVGRIPLVRFFRPTHTVDIREGQLHYRGPDRSLLGRLLASGPAPDPGLRAPCAPLGRWPVEAFEGAVRAATERLGDTLTKVVLSRYFVYADAIDLLDVFLDHCLGGRCSDAVFFDFGDVAAAIASPELLVEVQDDTVRAEPLAGTRRRHPGGVDDRAVADALLHDRKELAEHVLAVRQLTEDLRPVCAPDTLGITRLLDIVVQPEVLHLGSTLRGRLAAERSPVDALAAIFPSPMVGGVPRAEALDLIAQLEAFDRGIYGGASGWIDGRDCRFALNIRGVYRYGDRLYAQAGAGIMAESDPTREAAEIDAKLAALSATLAGTR